MKNSKKRTGLIALFACLLTAAVAFAAASQNLTIGGTVTITTDLAKVVFAVDDSETTKEFPISGDIVPFAEMTDSTSKDTPEITANTITLTDGSTTSDGTIALDGIEINLVKPGEKISYPLYLKNTGDETAYLESVHIADWAGSFDGWDPGGCLRLQLWIDGPDSDNPVADSYDGAETTWSASEAGFETTIEPDQQIRATLTFYWYPSSDESPLAPLPPLADTDGDGVGDTEKTYTIALGPITVTWSNEAQISE